MHESASFLDEFKITQFQFSFAVFFIRGIAANHGVCLFHQSNGIRKSKSFSNLAVLAVLFVILVIYQPNFPLNSDYYKPGTRS